MCFPTECLCARRPARRSCESARGTYERNFQLDSIWLFYNQFGDKSKFFSRPKWFNLLAGNDILLQQIKDGLSEKEIKESWENELVEYKKMRKKYLLYQDFE